MPNANGHGKRLVSVVIVTQCELAMSQLCASSALQRQGDSVTEVMIVDNGCPEPAIASVPENLDQRIRVLVGPEGKGLNSGRNLGVSQCKEEYILFLDDDAFLMPGAVSPLIELLEDGDVGIASGVVLDSRDPDRVQFAGVGVTRTGISVPWATGLPFSDVEQCGIREVQVAGGGYALIRRDLLQEIGGLDPAFDPIGYTQNDFSYQVRSTGRRILVDPRSRMVHWGTHFVRAFPGRSDYERIFLQHLELFQRRWAHMYRYEDGSSHAEAARQRRAEREMNRQYPRNSVNIHTYMYELFSHLWHTEGTVETPSIC